MGVNLDYEVLYTVIFGKKHFSLYASGIIWLTVLKNVSKDISKWVRGKRMMIKILGHLLTLQSSEWDITRDSTV